MSNEPIDLVYTWVDDSFPGYLEHLNQYASDKRDLNPNRTRDNLEMLRYAMRSAVQYLPQLRRIYLLTCRPQVPNWLDIDHPMIQVVHHDEIMAPEHVPTFSSFGIVSHLHLLPGLSETFIYSEDDMFMNSSKLMEGLHVKDGRALYCLDGTVIAPLTKLNTKKASPWNMALANADFELTKRFGQGPRRRAAHAPIMLTKAGMAAAVEEFPEVFETTRAARFRSGDGIPPEVFVPFYMVETGRAVRAHKSHTSRLEGYASIENFLPWTWWQLKRLDMRQPLSITLNDSFGERPNPKVEAYVRRWLNNKFPVPAPFERGP